MKKDFKELSREDLENNLLIAIDNIESLEKKVNKRRNMGENFAWMKGYRKGKQDAKDEGDESE